MRQSSIINKTSHGVSHNALVNAMAKLFEKKKEFDGVCALERASALYLERIEGLGEDCDIMADAGQGCGKVLEQWPKMFEILNLFLSSHDEGALNEGEQLVRVPLEDIQPTTSTS